MRSEDAGGSPVPIHHPGVSRKTDEQSDSHTNPTVDFILVGIKAITVS